MKGGDDIVINYNIIIDIITIIVICDRYFYDWRCCRNNNIW